MDSKRVMRPEEFTEFFKHKHPVIGMVHLPPLPGSPGYTGSMPAILERALEDAQSLERGGAAAVLLENLGDVPYYPQSAPVETVAAMSVVAWHLRQNIALPLGVNVLRNDGLAAMAIATAAGAQFIRVNVLAGVAASDQGFLHGQAHRIVRLRRMLSGDVKIFADVQVKHAQGIKQAPIEEEAVELAERAGADAIICTGSMTGKPVDLQTLRQLREALPGVAILAGSGVTAQSARAIFQYADAAIVGTSLKFGSSVHEKIDAAKVRHLVQTIKG